MLEAVKLPTDTIISYIRDELKSDGLKNNSNSLHINSDEKIKEQPTVKIYTLTDFDFCRVTKERNIFQPEPTITIAGAAVAAPENITGISAAAKAGKTAIKCVMISGSISKDGEIDGFLDLKVLPNPEGKAVIDFDTEQSEADQQQNLITVLRRAHFNLTPDYYRSYNIRQLGMGDYQVYTENICRLCNETFGGVHSIFIDGGADYIASVNDEAAAYNIVQFFTHLSIKYKCPVIVIVHQNPGSDKERGHFGSEIQRKCYGLLSITKEGDVSTLQPKIMRKAGNDDIPLINYRYCKEKGYHIEVETMNNDMAKDVKNRERIKEAATQVFAPPAALKHKDAVAKIMDITNKGLSTAKTMLGNMEGFGYVAKGNDDYYRLNIDKVNVGQNRSIDPD